MTGGIQFNVGANAMKPFWFFAFLSALTVTGQPVINKITIPAGMILKNREAIHFTGKIEPQLLVLVSGREEGLVSNWKFEARVEAFPYTPDLFQLRRVKTGSSTSFVDGGIKKIDVMTEEMVLKSNLTFTALFLSSPQTNYDALGRRTIIPAKPNFRYIETNAVSPEVSQDAKPAKSCAGIYCMSDRRYGRREKLDLRRDGSGFWFELDSFDKVTSKKSVAWLAANGKVVLRFENESREMTIEGDDMLDAQDNRWSRTR